MTKKLNYPGRGKYHFGAYLEGASLEGLFSWGYPPDEQFLHFDGRPAFFLAVNETDRKNLDLDEINRRIAREKTYDESERYAKALAREWHLELYAFDHRKSWRQLREPVYVFVRALALVPTARAHRWSLEIGAEVPLPSKTATLSATHDRFDSAYLRVEQACRAFEEIARLAEDEWFATRVATARSAVERAGRDARRLAALGQKLEGIDEPTDGLLARREALLDDLEAQRLAVLGQVELLTASYLARPDAPSVGLDSNATLDLESFAGGLDETRARLSAVTTSDERIVLLDDGADLPEAIRTAG